MNRKDEIAIRVDAVSKTFRLPHEKSTSLKSAFLNTVTNKVGYELQEALKDVSFEVKKGEFFGVVGRNGSGKSTLLKCMAGVYSPSKGNINIKGKLVPFIELGVGFNPDLSGRDNVFLNGALLGFSRKQMEDMYDEIVEFAEIEQFMDQKLKNYSSGMQVRLAFSIAIRAQGDVLLLDEVLAVGDEAFQRKCYQYFAEIRRNKQTVVLVTHSMDTVQQFCDRAILIDNGKVVKIGNPLDISQTYRELNDTTGVTINKNQNPKSTGTKYIDIKINHSEEKNKIVFDIELIPKQFMEDPVFAMGIYRSNGDPVYRWVSDEKLSTGIDINERKNIKVKLDDIFPAGEFIVTIFIKRKDRTMDYAIFNEITNFESKNKTPFRRDVLWRIPEQVFINGKEVKSVHGR